MTHTDYTKKILKIEDKNIYFNEDCLEIRKEDNKEYNIFHGYLTYNPEYCVHCGCVNNGKIKCLHSHRKCWILKYIHGKK